MKKIIIVLISMLSIYLWGCDSNSTTPDKENPYLLETGTNYYYDLEYCDSLWNITSSPIKLTMIFTDRKNYTDYYYNVFSVSSSDQDYGKGEAAFLPNSFSMNTRFGMPFIDTNITGDKLYGYQYLDTVKFNPFLPESQSSVRRDTVYDDWYIYQVLKSSTMMYATMLVQEWSSKTLEDTTITLLDKNQKCRQVIIYLNRLIRPKNSWYNSKFLRPSDDPSLDEFYLDEDVAIYADKIQMKVLYKEKTGFAEILIHHRNVWGDKYYKWKLTSIK